MRVARKLRDGDDMRARPDERVLQRLVPGAKAERVGVRRIEHAGIVDHHHLAPPRQHRGGVAQADERAAAGGFRQFRLLPQMAMPMSDILHPQPLKRRRRATAAPLAGPRRQHGGVRPVATGHQAVDRVRDFSRKALDPGDGLAEEPSIQKHGLRHLAYVPFARATRRPGGAAVWSVRSVAMRAAVPTTQPSWRKKAKEPIVGAESIAAASWPQIAAVKPSTTLCPGCPLTAAPARDTSFPTRRPSQSTITMPNTPAIRQQAGMRLDVRKPPQPTPRPYVASTDSSAAVSMPVRSEKESLSLFVRVAVTTSLTRIQQTRLHDEDGPQHDEPGEHQGRGRLRQARQGGAVCPGGGEDQDQRQADGQGQQPVVDVDRSIARIAKASSTLTRIRRWPCAVSHRQQKQSPER